MMLDEEKTLLDKTIFYDCFDKEGDFFEFFLFKDGTYIFICNREDILGIDIEEPINIATYLEVMFLSQLFDETTFRLKVKTYSVEKGSFYVFADMSSLSKEVGATYVAKA